ncbi:MAG: type 2 isopentenyl-diphosphate Delta-isomerase [Chloroflexi bacterium]|uniref:Isopentenyl-diphosphate delta-isomerase n=1 Tax=Candidatus Chlorohelix allophototropha TaxID=3003348 RepID=A0A8T7M508_9CHLR|nr:type 2 isopentenyl-diphosphate Delta-isomerase [Chloroflexota bacterium]WJW69101.1 type 2 isopentenyl-diphosphate Delta-isomerase [Chloroflexota bacterium L227-S17]
MSATDSEALATSERKVEHLRICLYEDVQAKGISAGLESYRFIHQALPEIDLAEVDLSLELFGRKVNAPILISSMTGGADWAARINRNLALAAEKWGVAMGVGSQRAAIEDAALRYSYAIRELAPNIPLLANIGAVQLNYGYGLQQCLTAVRMLEADALYLHLNALQEAVQPAGNINFKGLLAKIGEMCEALAKHNIPVIIKEVGNGLSREVCRKLYGVGVSGFDVAGSGGTSWSEVEKFRNKRQLDRNAAGNFADWGIPTSQSVIWAREAAPEATVIGSGGIRNGVDVAKIIALGGDVAGLAMPFLKAAEESSDAVEAVIEQLVRELRVAMFCIGAKDLKELRETPHFVRI